MAHTDGRAVEPERHDDAALRRAVAADQRLLERSAVTGEPAGQRHMRADRTDKASAEPAAVHVQAVGKDEYAGKIIGMKRATERSTARTRLPCGADLLAA